VIDKNSALFSHFSAKIDQIKNWQPSGHQIFNFWCLDGHQFAPLVDDILILKEEILVG
jgi:hypothetical protein